MRALGMGCLDFQAVAWGYSPHLCCCWPACPIPSGTSQPFGPRPGLVQVPMGAGGREKPLPSLGQCFTGAHWEAEGKSTQSNDFLTLSEGSYRQPDALERLSPDSLGHLWPTHKGA